MSASIKQYFSTQAAVSGCYPTPTDLIDRLLDGVNWGKISTVLEPSAGFGDMIEAVMTKAHIHGYCTVDNPLDLDYIEIDSHLQAILKYKFQGGRKAELQDQLRELRKDWQALRDDPERQNLERSLSNHIRTLNALSARQVESDFLCFDTQKRYDLIVMNPSFHCAEQHLLKAIAMQKRYGGEIRCIIGANTLKLPNTKIRVILSQELNDLGAEISFEQGAFLGAERKTDVEIALIKMSISAPQNKSEFFTQMEEAEQKSEASESTEALVPHEFIAQMIHRFSVESKAGLRLIKEYKAMRPMILSSTDGQDKYAEPLLRLSVNGQGDTLSENTYLNQVRKKYWRGLFDSPIITGKLTSKLAEKYKQMVNSLAAYDFSRYNIQQVLVAMNAELARGIQSCILDLFEQLTSKFTYYPEMEKNIHYFNGWCTNKAHKINSKVILPVSGIFSCWSRDLFDLHRAVNIVSDIEKVFDFFDGEMSAPVDLYTVMRDALEHKQTRNIVCKYFTVTFYKKGTMHIKFSNQELVDRFNIYCAKNKAWLPPRYGRTPYESLTKQERAVVDSFHGPNSREEYEKIVANPSYYLTDEGPLMLPSCPV